MRYDSYLCTASLALALILCCDCSCNRNKLVTSGLRFTPLRSNSRAPARLCFCYTNHPILNNNHNKQFMYQSCLILYIIKNESLIRYPYYSIITLISAKVNDFVYRQEVSTIQNMKYIQLKLQGKAYIQFNTKQIVKQFTFTTFATIHNPISSVSFSSIVFWDGNFSQSLHTTQLHSSYEFELKFVEMQYKELINTGIVILMATYFSNAKKIKDKVKIKLISCGVRSIFCTHF